MSPPRSVPVRSGFCGASATGAQPAASVYAVCTSDWAWAATALPVIRPPVATPRGNPVMAVPGDTPTAPFTIVSPVFVTVDAPRTPKAAAVPREMLSLQDCAWTMPTKRAP